MPEKTVFPGDAVRYHDFQQGIISCHGGSLRMASVDRGDEGPVPIALRIGTVRGPVCYLTTAKELRAMLDEVEQFQGHPTTFPEIEPEKPARVRTPPPPEDDDSHE